MTEVSHKAELIVLGLKTHKPPGSTVTESTRDKQMMHLEAVSPPDKATRLHALSHSGWCGIEFYQQSIKTKGALLKCRAGVKLSSKVLE